MTTNQPSTIHATELAAEATLSRTSGLSPTWRDYLELCKPRVVALMLLTALVGIYLAVPASQSLSLWLVLAAMTGIGLAAASGATINHLVDRRIDAIMWRTKKRPIPTGKIPPLQALYFALVMGGLGLGILAIWVNMLTAWLTLFTLIGYAGIYTLYLKRATPQNIVIGGAAGAAPPLLGWVAISNHITPGALLLVAIIYTWTPPHFWALCIHRYREYREAGIPMLPVTHGIPFTKLSIVLYTLLLICCTFLPYAIDMSGPIYLVGVMVINAIFLYKTIALYKSPTHAGAFKTFKFSIVYLMLLFVFLIIDHHFLPW